MPKKIVSQPTVSQAFAGKRAAATAPVSPARPTSRARQSQTVGQPIAAFDVSALAEMVADKVAGRQTPVPEVTNAKERPATPITANMAYIRERVQMLRGSLSELNATLQPIMVPEEPKADSDVRDTDMVTIGSSDVARFMRDVAYDLEALNEYVKQLNRRIEA